MSSSSATLYDKSPCPNHAGPVHARVLHVINGEHYSGAERVQDLLSAELPSCGFEVALACVKPELFPQMRQTTDTPLYDMRMRGRLDLRPIRQIAKLVTEKGFSLIHAHTPRTALVAALVSKSTSVPMVYHVHSPASRDSTHRINNWCNERLERWCLRQASAAIAVSESLGCDTIHRGVAPEKVFVVPNGVPTREPRPERQPNTPQWTLGTVALFRPRKGTEILLDALSLLKSAGAAVELRAVGGFETTAYENDLKHRTEKLGIADTVQWTGFTRDVDRELREMDLFVLPSLFGEGMPMVVLEAMAAGVPVIASRVEGIPETIRDGQDGLIVEPNNAESLASAIRQFVDGQADWSAMRQSALSRHAKHFSDHAMAAATADVYRRVLGIDEKSSPAKAQPK